MPGYNKKFIKINRELALEFRRAVFLKYNGDLYGNLNKEAEEAIRSHIKIMEKQTPPEMYEKYKASLNK